MAKKKQEYLAYKTKHIILVAALISFVVGIAVGMIAQQIMITESIYRAGEGWEGVISEMNIEIDLNETKLVEATYKVFDIEELNITEKGNKAQ